MHWPPRARPPTYETAERFRSFRPDLPLLAETSGKNAIIVTPSADLDLAVKDVVQSAFGHAGQKCSAASLVVLVGSVARSKRFKHQLLDAVSSLTVGYPWDPTTQMGPIIEPASGKLLTGLTELGPGETWQLRPEQLDDRGLLWSPGVRGGVRRGSDYHRTEYFGPILGVMTADTLDEAIDIVNEVDYGLTSGLHALDPAEIGAWLSRVEAGNLYVNRGITGAIVRRQPFGGWKRSAVGPGTKAGGVNYLIGLGSWEPTAASAGDAVTSAAVARLQADAGAGLSEPDRALLARAFRSDAHAWSTLFGTAADVSGLSAEWNVARYLPWPEPVLVRLTAGGSVASLVRVVGAAAAAEAAVAVSVDPECALPEAVRTALRAEPHVGSVAVESAEAFHARAGRLGGGRIRLIDGDVEAVRALAVATNGRPDLAVYAGPVTEAGRIELLPFLREQSIAITAHRFGTPNHLSDGLI